MIVNLIRHGETEWNRLKRYQGSCDIPLSAEGAAKLRRADFQPEVVYVTKLIRTQQTASLLFPDARQVIVPGLEEMHFGAFEGRSYLDMAQDPDYRAWVDGNCLGTCPGGESQADMMARTGRAFSELMAQAQARGDQSLTIVAHGGTQMALLRQYGSPERDYHAWLAGNGQGYRLDATNWDTRHRLTVLKELNFTGDS